MYYLPRTFICPKCEGSIEYSQSLSYSASPILKGGIPICPYCYAEWVSANVPAMIVKDKE